MSTELWTAATHRSGADLGTQLNSLASVSYSGVGAALDNSVNLDVWGIAVLSVQFGSAPNLDELVQLFGVVAVDGTNYEDGSSSLRYPQDSYLGVFQCYNTTNAQVLCTKPFQLRPFKTKFAAYNGTAQAFPASGSTITIWTFDRSMI